MSSKQIKMFFYEKINKFMFTWVYIIKVYGSSQILIVTFPFSIFAAVAIFCTALWERSDHLAALYKKDAEQYGEEDALLK